jgi:hypothetical protein
MEVSGQLHAPATLPLGKQPLVPIGEETGWALDPVCVLWKREKFYPARNRTPAIQVITCFF